MLFLLISLTFTDRNGMHHPEFHFKTTLAVYYSSDIFLSLFLSCSLQQASFYSCTFLESSTYPVKPLWNPSFSFNSFYYHPHHLSITLATSLQEPKSCWFQVSYITLTFKSMPFLKLISRYHTLLSSMKQLFSYQENISTDLHSSLSTSWFSSDLSTVSHILYQLLMRLKPSLFVNN